MESFIRIAALASLNIGEVLTPSATTGSHGDVVTGAGGDVYPDTDIFINEVIQATTWHEFDEGFEIAGPVGTDLSNYWICGYAVLKSDVDLPFYLNNVMRLDGTLGYKRDSNGNPVTPWQSTTDGDVNLNHKWSDSASSEDPRMRLPSESEPANRAPPAPPGAKKYARCDPTKDDRCPYDHTYTNVVGENVDATGGWGFEWFGFDDYGTTRGGYGGAGNVWYSNTDRRYHSKAYQNAYRFEGNIHGASSLRDNAALALVYCPGGDCGTRASPTGPL